MPRGKPNYLPEIHKNLRGGQNAGKFKTKIPETFWGKVSQYDLSLFRPDLQELCLNVIKFRQIFSIVFHKCCKLLKLR
jgi:hypothetical protein